MKKSKVIIPALAVLVLSTAASVTGTVAWFTATRERTVTAGEFKVAKTGDNLEVVLGSGIGTSATPGNYAISLGSTILTDASFNHTVTTNNIINPNGKRNLVQTAPSLEAATNDDRLVLRDTNTYSVATWTMSFSVSFGAVAGNDLGLFLDVAHAETYIREKFVAPDDDGDGGGTTHTFTESDAGTYYTNEACTEGSHTYSANESITAGTPLYKPAPDASGKGFRIAFVPTEIAVDTTAGGTDTHGTVGYAKVWAPHRTWSATDNSSEIKFVNKNASNTQLSDDNYDHNTTKFYWNSSSYQAATTTAGAAKESQKVLIDSSVTAALPEENSVTEAGALSTYANYLGMFDSSDNTKATITFTCVAWYDGNDAGVQNDKDLETVVASMHFKVVDLKAA